jgi:hypothetical protein
VWDLPVTNKRDNSVTVGSVARGLVGAIGIIGLLDDITPVTLYGHLQQWYKTYFGMIEKFRAFCFGWTEHLPVGLDRYFGVTTLEAHLTVVLMLLLVSLQRAMFFSNIDTALEECPPWLARFPFVVPLLIGCFAPLFALSIGVAMLVYPSWVTLPFCGFQLVFILLVAYTPVGQNVEADDGGPRPALLRREINSILIWVAVMIALNYSVFRLS